MKLTPNFTIEELTITNCGLPNVPNKEQITNLTALCENVLQPLRELYGKGIHVNSGFRSFEVNKAANKGAIKPSQHCKGEAADIDNGREENIKLFNLIKEHLPFDQLINENDFGWVHVSFKKTGNRKMILKL